MRGWLLNALKQLSCVLYGACELVVDVVVMGADCVLLPDI